ncbi:MAG: S8 family serine peptidase, partial [Alphaproteobacteria bacterium]
DDPNPTAVESGQMILPTDTGAVIAAVATDLDDQFASFSNRAGVAAEFTLAAPGVGVRTTVQNGGYGTGGGTSLSAPFIVGAIALLMEAFPNLTSREITEILFATATDLGAPGVDIESGHGLLNVEAAFQPLGMTTVAVLGSTGMTFVPVDGSGMIVGDAFGDAFSGSFTDVLMLDSYDRSFFIDFSDKMASRRLGLGLGAHFDSARAHGGFSLDLGAADLGLSYYDRFRDRRHLALALPASAQTTMSIERPAFNFKVQGPAGFEFNLAYGLAPQYVLTDADENRVMSGFLIPGLRLMDGMGIDRARETFAVSRTLDTKSRISFATTRSRYDLRAVAGLLGSRNGIAESVTTMMRIERDWGKARLALTSGALIEKGSVLGTLSSGALSLGRGATTLFSDVSLSTTTKGGLSLMARAAGGFTRVQGHSGSLIDDISSLTSLSFGAAASQTRIFNKSDRLGLAFSSPLRIESGRLGLTLPSGRDYQADRILFTGSNNSLKPSARELNFELFYAWAPRPTTELELNLVHQINPGHSNRFGNKSAVVLRSRTRF